MTVLQQLPKKYSEAAERLMEDSRSLKESAQLCREGKLKKE